MTVPIGHIELSSIDPPVRVLCPLGPGTPGFTGVQGGWATVPRAKRTALTEWQGHEPARAEYTVVFDGYADQRSVAADVAALERLATKIEGAAHPPIIRVAGAVRGTDLDWVMEGPIVWEEWRKTAGGVLVYQRATLQLVQHVAGRVVVSRSPIARGPAHYTIHVARSGDTLAKLATTYRQSWRALRDANPALRTYGPRRRLRAGQRLRIP